MTTNFGSLQADRQFLSAHFGHVINEYRINKVLDLDLDLLAGFLLKYAMRGDESRTGAYEHRSFP